jgi:hypothetical protein
MGVTEFTRSYLTTALWASTTPEGCPLDSEFAVNDIDPATLLRMTEDAELFYRYYHEHFPQATSANPDFQAGHDFWLSRNGHGAGFFEFPWPQKLGLFLHDASKTFGEYHLEVGDDGKINGLGGFRNPTKLKFKPYFHTFDWNPDEDTQGTAHLGISVPDPKPRKFSTPQVVMTPGAEDVEERLFDLNKDLAGYLERHFQGDWGEVGKEDWANNDSMLASKGMILSAYTVESGEKIWIVTDLGHQVTTILLPSEY